MKAKIYSKQKEYWFETMLISNKPVFVSDLTKLLTKKQIEKLEADENVVIEWQEEKKGKGK